MNKGTLEIEADAHAIGKGHNFAFANGNAVEQVAWGTAPRATLDNSGKIDLVMMDSATGGLGAAARPGGTGIVQIAASGTMELNNSGVIGVGVWAKATGASSAFIGVNALGVLQAGHDSLNKLDNSGSLTVKAVADVEAPRGAEAGSATGFYVRGDSADLDVSNSGTLDVQALGKAPDFARMEAIGIRVNAIGGSAATSTQQALVSGSIVNDGTLSVLVSANGGGPKTSQTFSGATVTYDQSSAQAIGISMYVGATNATITNSGTIAVDAVTDKGGPVDAHGVWVQGNGTGTPAKRRRRVHLQQ